MTTPNTQKLADCPFCGSGNLIEYHDPQTILHPWFRIECDNCGVKGPGSDRGDHAEQWNRRSQPVVSQPLTGEQFDQWFASEYPDTGDRQAKFRMSKVNDLMLAAFNAGARITATQAVSAPGWLPIESAPKDGRTMLLGLFNPLGKWRTMRGQWMSESYIEANWDNPDDAAPGWYETSVEADDGPTCWGIEPTHWQPLPAPPTQQGAPV